MPWIQVAQVEAIHTGECLPIRVAGLALVVFKIGDRLLALEDRCPHSGDPLAGGTVSGTSVTCPLHNWRICLETGLVIKPCVEGTPQVRTFPVEVRDGMIMLSVDVAQTAA